MSESGQPPGTPPGPMSFKDKSLAVSLFVLFIAFVVIFVFAAVFFLITGTFAILGITYDSWQSILSFIGMSMVSDLVLGGLLLFPKVLCAMVFRHSPRWQLLLFHLLLQFTFDLLSVHYIDEWMDGVTIGGGAEVGFVLIMIAIDTLIPDSRKKRTLNEGPPQDRVR
ncbi:regulatory YrvL family protein [Paenibacillus sp. S-38]|uniref:regulatory YrvL family protein n=1 Tax=Paenibacillus sp. S-38 TaxID=3416710 RepID=UPI003CF1C70B